MMKQIAAAAVSAALFTAATIVPLPTLAVAHAAPAKGCTDGKNRRVRMVNATSYTIQRMYGSNEGRTTWEEDVLGDSVLRPGNSVVVNWDDGTCYCVFDFKAVYSDGDTSTKRTVDVCRLETFRFVE
ncbi:hypothetical protein [Sphingomonas sp.]|uniref:hypothetical protein n=1 Tax=Sphingomonas sp. TaxID=28214 RepID=UPI003AFF7517